MPIQSLRDALRIPEGEGLVKIHPRAGIEFIKADMDFIRSTYQFRMIIESAAARRYAKRARAGWRSWPARCSGCDPRAPGTPP